MAFNVTFGSQESFDVGFQNDAQMNVSFRRNSEFHADTQAQEAFSSEFEGGAQMSAAFLNGTGRFPGGGAEGDLLAKKSDADGDVGWITPANEAEENDQKPITSDAVFRSVTATKEELLTIIDELRDEIAERTKMWFGTRVEYNSLIWIDPEVCYCIEEGT